MREWLLAEPRFVDMLERAEAEVLEAARTVTEELERDEAEAAEKTAAKRLRQDGGELCTPEAEELEADGDFDGDVYSDEVKSEKGEGADLPDQDRCILHVGCFCARGQHRSVGFVEELAKRKWPKNWELDVVHRDLGHSRASAKSENIKGKHFRRVDRFTSMLEE